MGTRIKLRQANLLFASAILTEVVWTAIYGISSGFMASIRLNLVVIVLVTMRIVALVASISVSPSIHKYIRGYTIVDHYYRQLEYRVSVFHLHHATFTYLLSHTQHVTQHSHTNTISGHSQKETMTERNDTNLQKQRYQGDGKGCLRRD